MDFSHHKVKEDVFGKAFKLKSIPVILLAKTFTNGDKRSEDPFAVCVGQRF